MQTFNDFIGNEHAKNQLLRYIEGTKKRGEKPKSILIDGDYGHGKTSLAILAAQEFVGDEYMALYPPHQLDYLRYTRFAVIDEAHALTRKQAEQLYGEIDEISFIFCTTHKGKLPKGLVDRCLLQLDLKPYEVEELTLIAQNAAKKHDLEIDVTEVVRRSRGVPREVVRFIEQLRDYPEYHADPGKFIVDVLEVNAFGLRNIDRAYLEYLFEQDKASVTELFSALTVPKETITDSIEPYLHKLGLIVVSSRGRQLANPRQAKNERFLELW